MWAVFQYQSRQQVGRVRCAKNERSESRDLAGASSGGKFVVSRSGEAYDAQPRGPNRKCRLNPLLGLDRLERNDPLAKGLQHGTCKWLMTHSEAVSKTNFQVRQQVMGRRNRLCALLLAFVASFFAYARRSGDFAGYVSVGNAVLGGRDIYLDTSPGVNTWPPFFSLVCVPLALLDRVSPYLVRIIWIALTWASIVWILNLIARLIYGKSLALRPGESSLAITSPELFIPFVLTLPYIVNNFELLQINSILFALVLGDCSCKRTGGKLREGSPSPQRRR